MTALIGLPNVGKSYLLNLLAKKGYKVFNSDLFFTKMYQFNNQGYQIIKNQLGDDFVNPLGVNRNILKKYALDHLDRLEQLVHPLLVEHLQHNRYDFVEIPVIKSAAFDFRPFFDLIVNIRDCDNSVKPPLFLHSVDKLFFRVIVNKNKALLELADVDICSNDVKKLIEIHQNNYK